VKFIRRLLKFSLAFALGIAAAFIYQWLSSPVRETLVTSKSQNGDFICVVDRCSAGARHSHDARDISDD
jgi:hypothetical protein